LTDQDYIYGGTSWVVPVATATNWTVGCKCGCENEDECHGDGGCDEDVDSGVLK